MLESLFVNWIWSLDVEKKKKKYSLSFSLSLSLSLSLSFSLVLSLLFSLSLCVCVRVRAAKRAFNVCLVKLKFLLLFSNKQTNKNRIQKWYTIYKDHITLDDYEVKDGSNLELYYN